MLADELNSHEARSLLKAIDQMRMVLHDEKFSLPQIVVVGDQSVGKSSVLEAISGIQLPRAQNICTRCPLELRMKSTNGKEYATISGESTKTSTASEDNHRMKTIEDLNTIADEVQEFTKKIAGTGSNVSQDPIYLTVYKKDIPYDLTLIDLPGITRNPLPDQPADIHTQILNLINKYIEPDTAVVLHVIPASVDFTTSESMKLAKAFDPECDRQLIAASKIDKFDKGIAAKLKGIGAGAMKLKLGCVAVLNRNQNEIDGNITFDEMKRREEQFFADHYAEFGELPKEYKGCAQLVKRLARIQQERIRSTFPQIIQKIRQEIHEKKQQLKRMPQVLLTEQDCLIKFQRMCIALHQNINAKINGDYSATTHGMNTNKDESTSTMTTEKVSFNDRLAYNVYEYQLRFEREFSQCFPEFMSNDYNKTVQSCIKEAAGVSLPNFCSFQIVEQLFRNEFKAVFKPCFDLIMDLHNYLKPTLFRVLEQTFEKQYQRLIDRLREVIERNLNETEEQCRDHVQKTIDMEQRLFTLNSHYMENVGRLQKLQQPGENTLNPTVTATATKEKSNKDPKSASSTSSTVDTDSTHESNIQKAALNIQMALSSYLDIVKRRMIDTISQICYYHFVTQCAQKLHETFMGSINSSSELMEIMREPLDQAYRREQLTTSINAFEEALRVGLKHM